MKQETMLVIRDFLDYEKRRGLLPRTIELKERVLERFAFFLDEMHPGRSLLTVMAEDVTAFLDSSGNELSPRSYNRMVQSLDQFYRYLRESGLAVMNPMARIDRVAEQNGNTMATVFTEDEVKQMLRAMPSTKLGIRDRALVELLYSTGIRATECAGLDTGDIDPETRELLIRQGKGGSERIVPVGKAACASLMRYMAIRYRFFYTGRDHDALFLSSMGYRVCRETIRRAIERCKERAGITTPGAVHALRHSCATHMLNRGAPLHVVQQLLGHGDLNATERYTHIAGDDLKRVHAGSHPGQHRKGRS